jgi:hypothetical protein
MVYKSVSLIGCATSAGYFITWVKDLFFSIVIFFWKNGLFPALENSVGRSRCVTRRMVDTLSGPRGPDAVFEPTVCMAVSSFGLMEPTTLEVTCELGIPPSVINLNGFLNNFRDLGDGLGVNNA